jgi:hypothetical protein
MTTARVVGLSVVGSLVCLSFFGCADPEPTTDGPVVANVDTKVTPQWSPPLTGGTCPDPALRPEWYQAKATTVIQYLVGGKDPFTPEEVTYNVSCKEAQELTTNLRNMINPPYGAKTAPTATLQAATSGNVCTLPAALYAIDISSQVPTSVWDAQRNVGKQLDDCWGVGVSGFYYADPTQDRVRRIYIDPEPARLTKDLFGSTGATAAAVYVNTGAETVVMKWPGSSTWSASPPPAGLPCSTGDIPWNTETLKIIQGTGSTRRCY